MFTTRRAGLLALPALLMVGLSGCSLLVAQGSSATLTGIAACAQGHVWSLDTADLAKQVLADLQKAAVPVTTVTATGSQTLDWSTAGDVTVTTDYTLTMTGTPAAGQTVVGVQTHKGSATGQAYVSGDVAIPRKWDATGLKVASTFTLNGAAEPNAPYATPTTDFDDSVGIILTCTSSTLTTNPRGSAITQKWNLKS